MTEIKRDRYLRLLTEYAWDGQIKVITGIRRCGKSYLLRVLYKKHLLGTGVLPEQIIETELDQAKDIRYRNPLELAAYVRGIAEKSDKPMYFFCDEIQLSDTVKNPYNPDGAKITFYDALNDLKSIPNLDIYVTGSNSKMLSSDILTEFRGRSDEIRVHPLSFAEYYSAKGGDRRDALDEYMLYGGLPLILSRPNDSARMKYLSDLIKEVYLKDIRERMHILYDDVLEQVLDMLCSSVGSLTNPTKICDSINSMQKRSSREKVSQNTIRSYIGHLEDAYLFHECKRYDVKGKNYFLYPYKYYCEDVGLRNARLGFRQSEPTHIMENIIYNELVQRGYSVDVGVVHDGKSTREIDFIATSGSKRIYIQSAYAMPTDEKQKTELLPFSLTGDMFPKVVIRSDIPKSFYDETGILNIGITEFLLNESLI